MMTPLSRTCECADANTGACRKNSTYIVTGHADGCVLWHHFVASPAAQPPPGLEPTLTLMPNNSFCPPCNTAADAPRPDGITLVHVGKVVATQRRMAAVAVAGGHRVLTLRERGRTPLVAHSAARVLHVHHDQRQVRTSDGGCEGCCVHSLATIWGVLQCARARQALCPLWWLPLRHAMRLQCL